MRRTFSPWLLCGVAVIAVVLIVVLASGSGGGKDYEVTVTVPAANELLAGQPIKVGGNTVGSIAKLEPIDGGRKATITLKITNPDVEPLPQGTHMTVRLGGTADYFNRYIRLDRGSPSAPKIPSGSTFPAKDFTIPVEFDQVLDTFDASNRASLVDFIDAAGPSLAAGRQPLIAALDDATPALVQAHAVLNDLNTDHVRLQSLLRTANSVVTAANESDPGVGQLIQGASDTINAVADQARNMETTLKQAPAALDQTNTTIARAQHTLTGVATLAGRLSPGITQLKAIAKPLDSVLHSIHVVGPSAVDTLQTIQHGAPQITKLVTRLQPLAPQLTSIGTQATAMVGCVRPYSPEILNLAQTWGDFLSNTDGQDKVLRAQVENFIPFAGNDNPETPAQLISKSPNVRYAFPNPPGNIVDQAWYQPQCGITSDALNPADDQEAKEKGGVL